MTPGSVLPKLHRRLPNGNERWKKLGEENLALNESGSIKEGGGGGGGKFLNKLIVGLGSVSEPGVVPLLEVLLLERVELA